ncbi:MAG: hydroxymethylbilane synthase [Planctomycetes bacterium]|nr:hydroxymethylbilane synthase [Planctomycetota bacterium]
MQMQNGGRFARVVAAFHQGEPLFRDALDQLPAGRVVVVPMMASRGYYCDDVLPRELRKSDRFDANMVRITLPVGAHPRMETLIGERVRVLIQTHNLRERALTVVLVGHGTPRHRASRETTETLTVRLQKHLFRMTFHAAFIDDDPSLDSVVEESSSGDLLVIPFFMSEGLHTLVDLPRSLGFEAITGDAAVCKRKGDRCVVLDRPVGHDPQVADIIEELANSQVWPAPQIASVRRRIRLGTRSSKMALWQAEHVAQMLAMRCDVELERFTTSGDRDQSRPIEQLPSSGPFTDEIDAALLAGRIDLAVHSQKDLPLRTLPGLRVGAVLPRGDARECIVTHGGVSLADLAPNTTVGTSSSRRAAQVRRLRDDLRIVPLRGPVDDRVRRVRSGELGAAVLAVAGLERLHMVSEAAQIFEIDEFLPAPAQAALAVLIRVDDTETAELVRHLDHAETRTCTQLELDVQRAFAKKPEILVAAYAEMLGANIQLKVRLIERESGHSRDVSVRGALATDVLAETLSQLNHPVTKQTEELVR